MAKNQLSINRRNRLEMCPGGKNVLKQGQAIKYVRAAING